MSDRLRLLTTHDFFGSFAPVPTSYGSLPGGEGLRLAAEAAGRSMPTSWIDTGDLVQGGPLTCLTGGRDGFSAAAELGVSVSVLGNHELDFGTDHFLEHMHGLGFPVLGGNAGIGLPAGHLLASEAGPIGVIGLTHPALASMSPWTRAPSRAMPVQPAADREVDVAGLAVDLRRAGARAVVLALHDGVDWSIDRDAHFHVEPDRLLRRLRPWARFVDVIAAGHTLGRFFGTIDGTPVLQPWPLGTELGVIDLEFAGGRVIRSEGRGLPVDARGRWTGTGSAAIDAAAADRLGTLASPLVALSGGEAPLATFLAEAMRRATGAGSAYAYATYAQPPLDGAFAALPAGPVTRLQLLQIVPYSDHRIVVAEITAEAAALLEPLTGPRPQARSTAWRRSGAVPTGEVTTVATTSGAAAAVIDGLVGTPLVWRDGGVRLDAAVREALADPRRTSK